MSNLNRYHCDLNEHFSLITITTKFHFGSIWLSFFFFYKRTKSLMILFCFGAIDHNLFKKLKLFSCNFFFIKNTESTFKNKTYPLIVANTRICMNDNLIQKILRALFHITPCNNQIHQYQPILPKRKRKYFEFVNYQRAFDKIFRNFMCSLTQREKTLDGEMMVFNCICPHNTCIRL